MGEKLLDHLAEDIGENYVYVRTIVENRFKLLKLDLLESVSKMAGYLLVSALIAFFFSISLVGLIVASSWYIGAIYDSPMIGVILGFAALIPIGILIFLGRRFFFYRPIANFLLHRFTEDENEETKHYG